MREQESTLILPGYDPLLLPGMDFDHPAKHVVERFLANGGSTPDPREANAVGIPDPHVMAVYNSCLARAEEGRKYALGGGHDPTKPFKPSKDIRAEYASTIGWDCSGVWSKTAHDGGVLEHDYALATPEIESWGLPGMGQWMGAHVIDTEEIHHAVWEFRIPFHHRWFAASHTGTVVGWLPYFDPTGYATRRRR